MAKKMIKIGKYAQQAMNESGGDEKVFLSLMAKRLEVTLPKGATVDQIKESIKKKLDDDIALI